MCGIAGIISTKAINVSSLIKMSDSIKHRGPDGEGVWTNEENTVGFAHRRLSIIDLSENGKQPMHYDDRYTITFNGEIYNYLELKKDLIEEGYRFKTNTDTEVLLALYSKEKEKCLHKLDGMFAFVIYDKMEKKIFGARDRFGEKPFYYMFKNKEFIFCSEIKGILTSGNDESINFKILYNFLQTSHILHNYDKPEETFYHSILKLPKANYFTIDENLNLTILPYWDLNTIKQNTTITFEEAKTEFTRLFNESIRLRLRSDVPLGSSLSGGLDSSTIVATIARLNQTSQHTFSARFKNYHRDEGKYIELVTNNLKVSKHYVWPDEEMFIEDFEKMFWHQDEPVSSASIYAQFAVMKKAKEEGVTVLLDGQGADEILAGYEYYLDFYLADVYKNQPNNYKSTLKEYSTLHKHLSFEDLALKKDVAVSGKKINPLLKFYKPKTYYLLKNNIPLPGFFSKEFMYSFKENPKPKNVSYQSLNDFLKYSVSTNNLEDLLRYSDRNSMAHAREVRLPFLSHKLVEFLFTLPAEFKIYKGWTKYLLRESMKDILPNEITWRVDKVGYEPPQTNWLRHKKISELTMHAFEKLQAKNIIHKNAKLSDNYK